MADTLSDVTKKLSENNQQNRLGHTETRNQLVQLNAKFDNFFTSLKEQFGDKLEDKRESRNEKAASRTAASSKSKDGTRVGILGLGGLGGVLGGLTAGLAALAASLTGLDDVLRAAFIVKVLAQVGAGLTRIAKGISNAGNSVIRALRSTVTGLREFGKNLRNVIVFSPEAKKAFTGFVDDLRLRFMIFSDELKKSFSQKLTEFRPQIVNNIVNSISDFLKAARVGILTTIPEDVGKLLTRVTDFLRPVTMFFSAIPEKLSAVGKFIPTINFAALKNLFVGAEGSGGILGFFTKIFNFLEPVLKPIRLILGTILRPFTQVVLSIIDFVVGFYKGFTGTDEKGFLDKLGAGIEGGIKGVIKGFTMAIDLLLVDFPAWIAKKLGFDKVAAGLNKFRLTDLVDPIYDAIKFFFTNIFTNPRAAFQPIVDSLKGIPLDFLKTILAAVLPDPNMFKVNTPSITVFGKTFGGGEFDLNPFPDSLYRFAGIDPGTGNKIIQSNTNMSAEDIADQDAFGGGGGFSGLSSAVVGNTIDQSNNVVSNYSPGGLGGPTQDSFKRGRGSR